MIKNFDELIDEFETSGKSYRNCMAYSDVDHERDIAVSETYEEAAANLKSVTRHVEIHLRAMIELIKIETITSSAHEIANDAKIELLEMLLNEKL